MSIYIIIIYLYLFKLIFFQSNELSALQEQCEEMTARLSRASQSSSEREQDLEAENRTLLGEIEELK
jgi:hypothetical protein